MAGNRREFLLGAATVAAGVSLSSLAPAAERAKAADLARTANAASPFLLEHDGIAVTSLRFAGDTFPTNYVATGQKLGHVDIAWRRPNGPWQQFQSEEATASPDSGGTYSVQDDGGKALAVTIGLKPQGSVLRWTIGLRNTSSGPIEVGDLALPLPMHATFSPKGSKAIPVLKHSFISGHGSFLFWMRANSVGPYLVMTPEHDTSLEYWDHPRGRRRQPSAFRAYVHSVAVGETVKAAG